MMSNHVEHDPVGTQVTTDNVAFEWRRERYEELGFNEAQAVALAGATETSFTVNKEKKRLTWETPLNWAKVKDKLDKGCTHELAIRIFAP